jgi:Phage integrase family
MRPKFTVADVEKAHDELKPHIAPLVAQFGPTQAHEIVTSALRDLVGEFPVEAQHIVGDAIAVKQEKTGTPLLIPLDIDPSLPESLASVPKTNMTFLVTKFGAPFTPGGFSNWFGAKCDEAGLQRQCTAHGLRKLVATRLADMACSEEEIKAITGHKSASEVARYTKARDQKRLAESAVGRLRKARATSTQGERKLSNLSTRLDKTASK